MHKIPIIYNAIVGDKATLYLDLTLRISQESYCERLQVGCLIVKNGNIISFGYNGQISGFPNKCEAPALEEIWKNSPYEGYQVNNKGQIRNAKGMILEGVVSKKGYMTVKIKKKTLFLHQILAQTFITNPDSSIYSQVNHIDGDKLNNDINNLEWCTNRYNCEERSRRLSRQNSLPMGIYPTEKGRKQPYVARVYSQGRIEVKRVYTIEEGLKFIEYFKDPIEYKTFRYNPINDLTTLEHVLHSESNAITKACKSPISTEGAVMYCTHACCVHCAKLIIQSGITTFVYIEDYRDRSGLELLIAAGLDVVKAKPV